MDAAGLGIGADRYFTGKRSVAGWEVAEDELGG